MPFPKNHKYRWKSNRTKALDKAPICFKGWEGQKERLKTVPNWQERIRELVEELIKESRQTE